ncbi:serine hydrolase [Acetivibrio saccincola]|uniref:Penicillin-binding protein 4 n=1 Tax=Acetivibrio saccincola TaxID=1677857 RepID=A0A2K9ELP2_9FIRM|nr:serine hydrolase [Acetivibrio saccincola]AUG58953.1 Penicillin-binding protein 4* [Acetivibrio saccincola]
MAKKLITILTVLAIIMSLMSFQVVANSQDIVVKIDGQAVDFPDAKPFINEDSRTLCPVRFIAENLGAEVEWNGANKTVLITKESTEILLTIGKNTALVNGTEKDFDTVPQIFENRTYVPLRFISEAFNMDVDWDANTRTVLISTPFDDTLTLPEHFDRYLSAMEKNRGFNGAVLIAKDDEILFTKGYGYSDIENNIKHTSKTKFAIGELTKTFTAMAVMQLHEKKLLNIEDKISKYIPDMAYGDNITIKHLITHTSGIVNYTDIIGMIEIEPEKLNKEIIIDLIKNYPPIFEPGTDWQYNNSGYVLLGHIIEEVSGLTLEEYFKENIFKPLKMNDTGVYSESDIKDLAKGYFGFLELKPLEDNETIIKTTYASGYMYSTVEDLFKWDLALKTDKLVKQETLDMIFDVHVKDDFFPGGFGLGWFIFKSEDFGDIIYHPGTINGFTCYMSRYVDENYTIIVAINKDNYNYDAVAEVLFRILNKKNYQMPAEIKEIKPDPEVLEKYTGLYEHSSGANIAITKSENQLYAQLPGQDKAEIYPMSETEFFYKVIEAYITFTKDDTGNITGLQFKQGDIVIDTVKTDVALKEKKIAEVDPEIYKEYAGEYEFETGLVLTVSTEDDRIFAQITGHLYLEIFPMSETEFFYEDYEVVIEFVKGEDGSVKGLIFKEFGEEYVLVKK